MDNVNIQPPILLLLLILDVIYGKMAFVLSVLQDGSLMLRANACLWLISAEPTAATAHASPAIRATP